MGSGRTKKLPKKHKKVLPSKKAIAKRKEAAVIAIDPHWVKEGHITAGVSKRSFWFYLQRIGPKNQDNEHQFEIWRIRGGCRDWSSLEEAREHFDLENWMAHHEGDYNRTYAKNACNDALRLLDKIEAIARQLDIRI